MLLKAMDVAKDSIGLLDFNSPEEYLVMDDYSIW
jgi:hypothetical protein